MDGVALLNQACEAGLKVVVENGCLKIRGPRSSAAVSQLLIGNKAAVIAALEMASPADLRRDFHQVSSGTGTKTPEIQTSNQVSEPANPPSHSFGGDDSTVDRIAKRHRLIGNDYVPRLTGQPPAAILATPAEICPECKRGRVLRELRVITGGQCWSCWEAGQKARSKAPAAKQTVAAKKDKT